MKKEEFIKGMKKLGVAFNKNFDEQECSVYYEFLNEYNYEVFKKSVNEIIKNNKFMPTISEVAKICEENKTQIRYEILENMKKNNYFKNEQEYEKATHFIETGVIPEWLLKDMKKEYKVLENKTLLLKS